MKIESSNNTFAINISLVRQETTVTPKRFKLLTRTFRIIRKPNNQPIYTNHWGKDLEVLRIKFENVQKDILHLRIGMQVLKMVDEFYEELDSNRIKLDALPVKLTIDRVMNKWSKNVWDSNKGDIVITLRTPKHNKTTEMDWVALAPISARLLMKWCDYELGAQTKEQHNTWLYT